MPITANPFKFGSELAKGQYFVDRKKEVGNLKRQLKNGERVLIFSARKYGKTTLIVNVLNMLEKEGWIQAYFDVSTAPDKLLFISKYKSLFIKPHSREWFVDWLKTNIPKIKISVGELELDASGLTNTDLDGALEKIIDLPQVLAQKEGRRVIVALDEFHEINNLGKRAKKLLRSRLQFHDKVSYVFSGSETHILQDMFEKKYEPFYKAARLTELHKIPKDEYTQFILNAFRSSGIEISDEMVSDILARTDSNTYFTQALCHELWDACKVRGGATAESKDFEEAIKEVILDQSSVYERIWEDLSIAERKLLIGILTGGSSQVWSAEFKSRMRLSDGAVEYALKSLLGRYLIERSEENGRRPAIPDPFFKTWLQRKIDNNHR